MRSSEIHYFANLLSSLTISAARAKTPDLLAEVGAALEEAYVDIFSLLSHDAMGGHEALVAGLVERAAAAADRDGSVRA